MIIRHVILKAVQLEILHTVSQAASHSFTWTSLFFLTVSRGRRRAPSLTFIYKSLTLVLCCASKSKTFVITLVRTCLSSHEVHATVNL